MRRSSAKLLRRSHSRSVRRASKQVRVAPSCPRDARIFKLMAGLHAVAIAYVMQKTPHVFPIVGCRKLEQLQANIEALDIALSPEQIKYLEGVLPFDLGFPHAMVVSTSLRLKGLRDTQCDNARAMARSISAWPSLRVTLTSGLERRQSGHLREGQSHSSDVYDKSSCTCA